MSSIELTLLQKKELELAEKSGLNEAQLQILTSGLNYLQMRSVRNAFESGMEINDVRAIADAKISSEDMDELFHAYLNREEPTIPLSELPSQAIPSHRIRNTVIACVGTSIGCIALVGWCLQIQSPDPFTLKQEEIHLACGSEFVPQAYVDAEESIQAQMEMPTLFHAQIPEDRIVQYRLQKNGKDYSRYLRIHIVDETSPTITLQKKEVTILKGYPFRAEDYLLSAADEVDGDLTKNVSWSEADFSDFGDVYVTYAVQDRAGNMASAQLLVHVVDPMREGEEELEKIVEPVSPNPTPIHTPTPIPPVEYDVPSTITESEVEVITETITESIQAGETYVEFPG